MKTQKLLVPFFAIVLVSGMFFVAPTAYAQTTNSTSHGNFFQGLIQYIAQKFGLDKTQVQSAVNSYQAQNKANITPRPTLTTQQIQDNDKSRLDKLVTQGKITPSQEQAILGELSSLRSKYNLSNMQSLTPQERQSQFQSMQNDIKTWATTQGINPSYVMMFGMGGPRGRGMRGPGGHYGGWGMKPTATPSATATPTPQQ